MKKMRGKNEIGNLHNTWEQNKEKDENWKMEILQGNDISGIRLFKGILLNKYGSIFFMNSASKTMSTNKILCGNDLDRKSVV